MNQFFDVLTSKSQNYNKIKDVFDVIIKNKNFPNLIISSHKNSFKLELIMYFLKKFFKDVNIKDYVYVVNANEDGGIKIIKEKIKNFASAAINTFNFEKGYYFKIIILENANSLTQDAQNALRRIMEDFSKVSRFILLINDERTIIDPIYSRCSSIFFPKYEEEIILLAIDIFYGDNTLNNIQKQKLLELSNYNLSKLRLLCDLIKNKDFNEIIEIYEKNTFKYDCDNDKNYSFYINRENQCSKYLNF